MQLDAQTSIQLSREEQKELVRDQLLADIELLLTPYRNKDIGMRIIAEKTSISEKTYQRIIDKSTIPHLSTVERFYRYFFEMIREDQQTAEHQQVKRLLKTEALQPDLKFNHQLEKMLEENKVLREIFLYSRTGIITRQFIKDEFGKYGLEIVDLLLTHHILIEKDKGLYAAGNFSIAKTNKAVKKMVEELISDNLDPEKLSELGNNKAFYAVEGIDSASKHELLKLMDEYQLKLMNFMFHQARPGEHRMFVAAAADQLKRQIKIENDNQQLLQ